MYRTVTSARAGKTKKTIVAVAPTFVCDNRAEKRGEVHMYFCGAISYYCLALKSQLGNQNFVDSPVLHKIRRKAQGFGRGETPSRGQKVGKSAMVYFMVLPEYWCLFCGIMKSTRFCKITIFLIHWKL